MSPRLQAVDDARRCLPDPDRLPRAPVTRFAPSPTGRLHLGHLLNALYVWGIARATGGTVVLRVEDHDRQRSRHEHEAVMLDDLDRLGLRPDRPSTDDLRAGPSPYRQSDDDAPYAAAVALLRARGLVYACECSRADVAGWTGGRAVAPAGAGCPGGCRERALSEAPHRAQRVALGDGEETVDDLLLGRWSGPVAPWGDPVVRDRLGNRGYTLCVVVDDARQGVDLVIRGRDLRDATPFQVRLRRALGIAGPPAYLHHPLVLRPDGAKLSKANDDTAIRELLGAGVRPAELFGMAAAAAGLRPTPEPIDPDRIGDLFTG
jgi:glutamyl/glutaminyl-tRNA synthetase